MFGRRAKNKVGSSDAAVDPLFEMITMLEKELDEIEHSCRPDTFFVAYHRSIDLCGDIMSNKCGRPYDNQILKTLKYLFVNKTEITNRFLDRLSTSGRLSHDIDALISHKNFMTEESYDYFLSLTGIDELTYIYCSVSFGSGRTYDYICEIADIKVGDKVIVPVGEEETERLATVTAINEYSYDETPYPVSKTKKILAKYGCGL